MTAQPGVSGTSNVATRPSTQSPAKQIDVVAALTSGADLYLAGITRSTTEVVGQVQNGTTALLQALLPVEKLTEENFNLKFGRNFVGANESIGEVIKAARDSVVTLGRLAEKLPTAQEFDSARTAIAHLADRAEARCGQLEARLHQWLDIGGRQARVQDQVELLVKELATNLAGSVSGAATVHSFRETVMAATAPVVQDPISGKPDLSDINKQIKKIENFSKAVPGYAGELVIVLSALRKVAGTPFGVKEGEESQSVATVTTAPAAALLTPEPTPPGMVVVPEDKMQAIVDAAAASAAASQNIIREAQEAVPTESPRSEAGNPQPPTLAVVVAHTPPASPIAPVAVPASSTVPTPKPTDAKLEMTSTPSEPPHLRTRVVIAPTPVTSPGSATPVVAAPSEPALPKPIVASAPATAPAPVTPVVPVVVPTPAPAPHDTVTVTVTVPVAAAASAPLVTLTPAPAVLPNRMAESFSTPTGGSIELFVETDGKGFCQIRHSALGDTVKFTIGESGPQGTARATLLTELQAELLEMHNRRSLTPDQAKALITRMHALAPEAATVIREPLALSEETRKHTVLGTVRAGDEAALDILLGNGNLLTANYRSMGAGDGFLKAEFGLIAGKIVVAFRAAGHGGFNPARDAEVIFVGKAVDSRKQLEGALSQAIASYRACSSEAILNQNFLGSDVTKLILGSESGKILRARNADLSSFAGHRIPFAHGATVTNVKFSRLGSESNPMQLQFDSGFVMDDCTIDGGSVVIGMAHKGDRFVLRKLVSSGKAKVHLDLEANSGERGRIEDCSFVDGRVTGVAKNCDLVNTVISAEMPTLDQFLPGYTMTGCQYHAPKRSWGRTVGSGRIERA
jgi:hypothetical protein